MAWRLVEFGALTTADLAAWRRIREADLAMDSPFFHPGFSAAVHSVFGDVQVATYDDHQVWFPVQVSKRLARPVGWPGADFQGPVAAPGVRVDPLELVRGTGLRSLQFHHLPETWTDFAPWVRERKPSPYIDASGGLDGYLTRVSKAGRDKMSRVRRMTNKAARELGEVRLEWSTQDPRLLDWVIDVKRAQYAATGAYDFFAMPRRRQLIHQLAQTRTDGFAGMLSAVYAGETLLAAHFGLCDRAVLHWWFPAFDRAHADLAPGWILLRELIAAAPVNGVTRIDLGFGDEDYKRRAMTGSVSLCDGMVTADPLRRQVWLARRAAIDRLKSSSLGPRLAVAKNRAMRFRETLQ